MKGVSCASPQPGQAILPASEPQHPRVLVAILEAKFPHQSGISPPHADQNLTATMFSVSHRVAHEDPVHHPEDCGEYCLNIILPCYRRTSDASRYLLLIDYRKQDPVQSVSNLVQAS